jgi:F-type H+-transporting ATPase subunit a
MLRRRLRGAAGLAVAALLLLPALAAAAEEGKEFEPSDEFALEPYVGIELGPLDLSINKAVVYLMLASAICIGVGIFVVRGGLRLRPTRAQNVIEVLYEFAENQIGRQTLPAKAMGKYFPYLATLFLFILVNNMISFIPLPVGHESSLGPIPDLALYAATANINVTVALALVTFVITHVEGVRAHGVGGYLKSWIPGGTGGVMGGLIWVLEALSQLLRLVSLSVRLFANLLAGHLLIIMAGGFSILLGSFAGVVAIPFGLFFYIFEWVLVAGLQAFIFAMLSGIYIGFAVEHQH